MLDLCLSCPSDPEGRGAEVTVTLCCPVWPTRIPHFGIREGARILRKPPAKRREPAPGKFCSYINIFLPRLNTATFSFLGMAIKAHFNNTGLPGDVCIWLLFQPFSFTGMAPGWRDPPARSGNSAPSPNPSHSSHSL